MVNTKERERERIDEAYILLDSQIIKKIIEIRSQYVFDKRVGRH